MTVARTSAISALGAAAGAVAGLLGLAGAGFFLIEETADARLLDPGTGLASARFVATSGATYLLVLVLGAVFGLVLARLTIGLTASAHPEEPRVSARSLLAVAAGLGAVTAYGVLRGAIGVGGDIVRDPTSGVTTITVTVFRAPIIALIVGAATGLVIAPVAEWLSRPAALGLTGVAWPKTVAEFVKESMPAMVIPVLSLVTLGVIAFAFSRVLLFEPGAFAVTVFSVAAAVVLAAGAFFAYMTGPEEPPEED